MAVDVVVGLILVPRRRLARRRLLHEHVVMEEPHPPRAHQLPCDLRGRRLPDEPLVLGDPLPAAEVLEEAARVVRAARDERALARLCEIAVDPARHERNLVVREGAADADGAVAAEGVDELGGDHRPDRRAVESAL